MQHSEIAGFTDQSEKNKAYVNENKYAEERILRTLEHLEGEGYDGRNLAIARTKFQEAFMWMNRAIFQPQRIELPEDTPVSVIPVMAKPSVYVGETYRVADDVTKGVLTKTEDGRLLTAFGAHWYLAEEVDAYVAAGGVM